MTTVIGTKLYTTFIFRLSIDSAGKQRYSEDEINSEINNDNVKIEKRLLIRKSDGAVLGEILTK